MKKSLFSLVSILALSGVSLADSSAGSAEEPTSNPLLVAYESAFYLGAGISKSELNNDLTDEVFSANGVVLHLGYQYNRYLAVEGRYAYNIGGVDYTRGSTNSPDYADYADYPTDFTNAAIYIKPIYPVNHFFFYALLGYGEVTLTNIPIGGTDRTESGFQWGLGAGYTFKEKVSVFVDYVQMYSGTGFDGIAANADAQADAWAIGISYKF